MVNMMATFLTFGCIAGSGVAVFSLMGNGKKIEGYFLCGVWCGVGGLCSVVSCGVLSLRVVSCPLVCRQQSRAHAPRGRALDASLHSRAPLHARAPCGFWLEQMLAHMPNARQLRSAPSPSSSAFVHSSACLLCSCGWVYGVCQARLKPGEGKGCQGKG